MIPAPGRRSVTETLVTPCCPSRAKSAGVSARIAAETDAASGAVVLTAKLTIAPAPPVLADSFRPPALPRLRRRRRERRRRCWAAAVGGAAASLPSVTEKIVTDDGCSWPAAAASVAFTAATLTSCAGTPPRMSWPES